VIVRSQDAKRTGSGQRGKPRRSLQDRELPGHVADNVGRHFGCGGGGRSRRVAGRVLGRQHVHGREQGVSLDRPLQQDGLAGLAIEQPQRWRGGYAALDGSLPHEDELQQDFFRWVATYAAGSDLEPTNIASGRADIRLKSGPERLVVEVKREEKDSSFDALFKSYAAQTTDYQNVSIRLGALLVLDLATPNREGTPHLTSLFEIRRVFRQGEDQSRLILIVKIPGRRKRPSDLTKLSKTSRS